jgi:hypothetical protein
MGKLHRPLPVKLVISLIYREATVLRKTQTELENGFGPVEPDTLDLPFDKTDYYAVEMGRNLQRRMIAFRGLIPLENAHRIKLRTGALEKRYTAGGKRRINIDPGYLNNAKLVLFTTKDYSHRIYLGDHIFAENTMSFREGEFRSLPWTYPDYASSQMRCFFGRIRDRYRLDMKNRPGERK